MYFWFCVTVIVAAILGVSLLFMAVWRSSMLALNTGFCALVMFLCGSVILLRYSEKFANFSILELAMSSGNVLMVIGGIALLVFAFSMLLSLDIKARRDLVAFMGWSACLMGGGSVISIICR